MKQSIRDTYKYEVYDGNELVYVGETNNLKRRESEHRRKKWNFTKMVRVGRVTTKESAYKWQGERLKTYMKNHKGNLPRYSKSQLGDSIR